MKFVYDHDLHIHSKLSSCSKDERQTPTRILQYAQDNGLNTVCVTDHLWDDAVESYTDRGDYKTQNFAHILQSKPLPTAAGIRFLFGCETEMDQILTIGLSKARYKDLDFIIIPTTHMHMQGFTISEADGATAKTRAAAWVRRLNAVLNADLPFHKVGLAHLTCGHIAQQREVCLDTINSISNDDLARLFKRAGELGVGIELNAHDMGFADEEADVILRPYRIAKEFGCKFYCGSDAHTPEGFAYAKNFARAIDLLALDEADKFRVEDKLKS